MTKLFNIAAVLPHGQVVLYEHENTPLLGLIQGFKNQKYVIWNERGREAEIPSNRLSTYRIQGPGQNSTQAERSAFLNNLRATVDTKVAELSLEDLWTVTHESGKDYTDAELADIYFNTSSPEFHLVARIALLAERTFFKRSKFGFIPRNPDEVAEVKRADEVLRKKRSERQVVSEFLRGRISGTEAEIPSQLAIYIEALKEYAVQPEDTEATLRKDAAELLSVARHDLDIDMSGSTREQAYKLLVAARIWKRYQSFSLLRHQIETSWSEALLSECHSLPTVDHHGREDLRNLETFTIDDQKTKDMDDALSLERTPQGFRLGIHITDVASYLLPGSPLELETARRATSVYCPEQSIHMLPSEISEARLSLLAGADRFALSCLLDVAPNFEIIGSRFVPSIINSKRRLTYDEADHLLEHGDELLTDLFNIASCNEEKRIRDGGARIEKRDAQIVVQDDGEMKLLEIDEASTSRSLIAEMMVLYNSIMADYCSTHQLAIPFRSQEAPDNEQAPPLEAGPAFDFAIRSRLKRSLVTDTPASHYTLGLQRYTQATSPLRRYLDLCTQRQVLSFLLTGNAAYSREEMVSKISESEQPLGRANAASREARRFWFLAYLCERAKTNNKIGATILRIDDRGILLELDETYMTATTRQAPGVRVGQHIQVKIMKSEPFGDYIRLEIA